MYYPLNYDQINLLAGTYQPSPVKNRNNKSFDYFVRSLFQRATTVFEWELPENWNGNIKDFFLYCLFKFGYVVISDFPEYGMGFQPCGLSGYNFYYQPTKAVIGNPALKSSLELEISRECELLKLTPDYMGVWDILEFYAKKLALLEEAIDMALINNKFAFFIGAKNKAAGQAIKKMLDLVNKGNPAVVWDMKIMNDPTDKDIPFQEWKRDINEKLTTELLTNFRTIIADFDAEIGIPTNGFEKKERMITDEANIKQADGKARSITWYETIETSIDKIKVLYPGINLSCSMRYETVGEPQKDIGGINNE
ncbi:MAG: hypothetical protein J6S67_13165 [Methanobrevibacter sp.]|nr:hypothetical protein [Methanobrevibacter sp.]